MAGRPRLPIGTFGAITTTQLGPRRLRASTHVRDWDGQTRQVTATGSSRNAAQSALKLDLTAGVAGQPTVRSGQPGRVGPRVPHLRCSGQAS